MGHSRWTTTLDHYGLQSTRINRGQSHENGVAEQGHYRLKDAIDQALILRGSRDFDTTDDYADFVREMVAKRNRLVQGKLEQELPSLGPLPPAPMPEYANYRSKVRRWSTVQVAGLTYSVPSRLIGKEVRIRLYSDHLEVYYKDNLVERMARMHGEGEANVNYRHVIGSLVRKPGPSLAIASGSSCFPPCASASPMTHSGMAWGTGRRGVRADPAPGGDHHGSHGGQRPGPAAGSGRVLRLCRSKGAGGAEAAGGAGADFG